MHDAGPFSTFASHRLAYLLDGVEGSIGPADEAACLPPGALQVSSSLGSYDT